MEINYSSKNKNYTIEDLEELLDNIPYEIWIKDENGKHEYINRVSAEKMGYMKEDLLGKTDFDFRPKFMAEQCTLSDKKVLKSNIGILMEQKVSLNGDERWYEVCKVKLPGKHNLIGGIAREVTVDKTLQNSIIESSLIFSDKNYKSNLKEKILKQLKIKLQAIDVAMYIYEESSQTMKLDIQLGKLKENNNSLKLTNLYKLDEIWRTILLNKGRFDIVHKVNEMKYNIKIFPIRNGNKLIGALHVYSDVNMIPKYIQEDMVAATCISLGVIIENKELSNKLSNELKKREEVQNNLKLILETSIDIYATIIVTNNSIKWVEISEKGTSILGWNLDDCNTQMITQFIHPEDRIKLLRAIKNTYKNGMCKNFICRTLCKNGKYKVMEWNWNFIKENSKYIVTARDMSKIANLLEEKKNLESTIELEELKNEFFANLSHEFKTPLNIILTTVQVISDYVDNNLNMKNNKIKKYIKGIKQNSFRLLKLANNLIDITKIDDGYYQLELDNYNIVDIIENLVLSVANYIQNNKRNITFDTTEEEIILACDPEKIERIILNLLSNSIKFTEDGGNIYINLEVNDECNKVMIKVGNDGKALCKSDSEKIFKRFTQVEKLFTRGNEGTGIGLSLVKSLVEMHKGKIYVNTEIEQGTEFNIELPIIKIRNTKSNHIMEKNLNSEVQNFDIEFSDIYN